MRTIPTSEELLAVVSEFLRAPQHGWPKFHAQVVANALDIVRRDVQLSPAADYDDLRALRELLQRDGTLEDLENAVATGIRDGSVDLRNPKLLQYLWQSTLANMAIDQPGYATLGVVKNRRRESPALL